MPDGHAQLVCVPSPEKQSQLGSPKGLRVTAYHPIRMNQAINTPGLSTFVLVFKDRFQFGFFACMFLFLRISSEKRFYFYVEINKIRKDVNFAYSSALTSEFTIKLGISFGGKRKL